MRKLRTLLSHDKPPHTPSGLDSPRHQSELRNLMQLAGTPQVTIHYERYGIPEQTRTLPLILNEPATSSAQSEQASKTSTSSPQSQVKDVYRVPSLTKLYITAAFLRLFHDDKYRHLEISWKDSASDVLNRFRNEHGKSSIRRLVGNPTVRLLLLHHNGIAPMDRYLSGPNGAPLITEAEFLDIARSVTEEQYGDGGIRSWSAYSNANYIYAGLILEAIFDKDISLVLSELLFEPFGMTETQITGWCPTDLFLRLVEGHHISADRKTSTVVIREDATDVIELCMFGATSSVPDIAIFFRRFIEGFVEQKGSIITKDMFNDYFLKDEVKTKEGHGVRLGGDYFSISSKRLGFGSLNNILTRTEDSVGYSLGKKPNGSQCNAFYTSGTTNGFSCVSYFIPEEMMFVLVVANSSGPLDITDYIAHYVLQEVLDLHPKIDIRASAALKLEKTAQVLQRFEHDDSQSVSSGKVDDIVGTYRHSKYGQLLTITNDRSTGQIEVHGSSKRAGFFNLARTSQTQLRVLPQAGSPFGIERWSSWRELNFDVKFHEAHQVQLVQGSNVYERLVR